MISQLKNFNGMETKTILNDTSIIKSIRPFGNIDDKRLTPYIYEAEKECVINYLGVKFYKALVEDNNNTYANVLNGGYYNDDNNYFEGLYRAISYLAYSRFIRNQDTTITQMSVIDKLNDLSDKTSSDDIIRLANDTDELGKKYLYHTKEYCIYMKYIEDDKRTIERNTSINIKVIGE